MSAKLLRSRPGGADEHVPPGPARCLTCTARARRDDAGHSDRRPFCVLDVDVAAAELPGEQLATRSTSGFSLITTWRSVSGTGWPSGFSVRTSKNLVVHAHCTGRVCPFTRPPARRAELIFTALIFEAASGADHRCLCHVVPKIGRGRVRWGGDRHLRAAQFALDLGVREVARARRSPRGRVVDHHPPMTCP